MRYTFFFFLGLCFSISSFGQNDSENVLKDLYFYGDIMVNADSEIHRLRANEIFKNKFKEALEMKGSYDVALQSIPYISTVMPPDSSFKIFTFSYAEDSGRSTDFGFIQKKNGQVLKLTAEKHLEDIEYEQLEIDRWVSGVYYHIIPFLYNEKQYYVLFGFSQPSDYENRKVLEIFHWEDGKAVFGAELFVERQENARDIKKQRLIYHFASDAVMTIRDDSDFGAIVIDHLMPIKSKASGFSRNTYAPDGTYTAYFFENGEWIYKDKLYEEKDVQKFEKQEIEEDTKRSKDIFGKGNK